MTGYF